MKAPADKSPDTQRQAAAHEAPQQQSNAEAGYEFVDNREETADLRQLQEISGNSPQAQGLAQLSAMMNSSPRSGAMQNLQAAVDNSPRQVTQRQQHSGIQDKTMGLQAESGDVMNSEPVQRVEDEELLQGKFTAESPVQLAQQPKAKPNTTGLPDNLKAGVESLSGLSLDNVKVHYNSSEPAQLNAHAYAQGTDIHLGPGQEQHLPHEAWHVVQQAKGRVKPTMQMKGKVNVNDDAALEKEADVMGDNALSVNTLNDVNHSMDLKGTSENINSRDAPVQGRFGFEIEVPIFFTQAVNGYPNMREDPGTNTHIDQGSFEVHVDHNQELLPLAAYAYANQNGNWDGFAGGPPITEIVTKPWDEFVLSENDIKDRAANIEHWVEAVYARASAGEANLGGDYYVGSASPQRTLQSTLGYFQTTYGIKLSKTPDLFKQSGRAAKTNDPGEKTASANQLIKAGKAGPSVISSLKKYAIESGWFKDKVSGQATQDEFNMLAGYTTLLANYIIADVAIANGVGLGKNLIGDYFYKTDLGSLSNALPDSIKDLLRNNARVRTKFINLLSSKCNRDAGGDMSIGMTISAWVTQVLNGGRDVFLDDFINPYSNELASEPIGPGGSQEAGVVMENREPQNLDPETRQKRRDKENEMAAFFGGGGGKDPDQLKGFLRDLSDPKKYPIDQWESVMLRIYRLLREING